MERPGSTLSKIVRSKGFRYLVIVLVGAGLLRALLVRTETWFYDRRTGALREVVDYSLPGANPRIRLLTLRDSITETELSAYLRGVSAAKRARGEWIMMSQHESGLVSTIHAQGRYPDILHYYGLFQQYYKPLLSDREYLRLVRLALHPQHYIAVDQLLDHRFLSRMEDAADALAKRKLMKKRLGPLWSKCVDNAQRRKNAGPAKP
jgi:hypothetical protein